MRGLLLIACVAPAAAIEYSEVEVENGKLRGLMSNSGKSRFFKGIPFAEPPVGNNRWSAPVPISTQWLETRDATQFKSDCAQGPFNPPITNTSEDCLHLSIYAPPKPANASVRFPVMLWLHGGGYTGGGDNEQRLNGTWVVEMRRNCVIVVINYR
jgi:para-nitrobenzyl esterase